MKQRLAAIDGLRGAAMLTVLIQHLFGKPYDWMPLQVGGLAWYPFPFLSNGFHALALFFMLSGFVLYLPYAEGKRTMQNHRDASVYFVRRSLRLLPLLIGSSFLISLVYHLGTGSSLLDDFWTMLRQTVVHEVDYPLHNSVLWSLRTELWFCVAFPLIAWAGLRFGMRRVAFFLCAVAVAVKITGVFLEPSIGPKLLRDSALGRFDDFVLGMLIAELYARSSSQLRIAMPWIWAILLVLLGCEVVALNRSGIISAYADPFACFSVSIAFAIVIGTLLIKEEGFMYRVFASQRLRYLGRTSYSTYIWHVPLMTLLTPGKSTMHLIVFLVTLAGVARLSVALFERPFLMKKRPVSAS